MGNKSEKEDKHVNLFLSLLFLLALIVSLVFYYRGANERSGEGGVFYQVVKTQEDGTKLVSREFSQDEVCDDEGRCCFDFSGLEWFSF